MARAAAPAGQQPFSVTQLTRYLKYLVEQDEFLAALSVEGEICELSRSPAGHIYLSLKDAGSQVAGVLFRREASQQLDQVEQLRKGIAVIVHGFLTVYEPRGTCQIYVERVLVQGDGALHRRFEALRARLEKEGLFAEERKRPLPPFPRAIALVTSPGSQAYHDVLHRLRIQYPFVTVIEAGVSVQGDGAADEVAMAIDIVNRLTRADVILVVRGGGSPEDLAAFNDERLARAIFASRIPVVTGIGHETDYTIADFVADQRAATPSMAAAISVPDVGALVRRAGQLHLQIGDTMRTRLRHDKRRWLDVNQALVRASPTNRLRSQQQRADELARAGRRAIAAHLCAKREKLDSLRRQLEALDPLAILARGYAVLTDAETDRAVGTVTAAVPGRRLRVQVADGQFQVRVTADD